MPRTILIHLNFEVPDDSTVKVNNLEGMVDAAVESALRSMRQGDGTRQSNWAAITGEIVLAEEV